MRAILHAFLLLCIISWTAAADHPGVLNARGGAASILKETGFLDYLGARYNADTERAVNWVSADAARLVQLGKACEIDLLLTDGSREAMGFMEDGHGSELRFVMYSDYVLVGPSRDPAGLSGKNILTALSVIASRHVPFVNSEGDSAAYQKELFLWREAGVDLTAGQPWYLRSGKRGADALEETARTGAHAIIDRGAFLMYGERAGASASLSILVEGERVLRNQFSVIIVDPERCGHLKSQTSKSENGGEGVDALAFVEWVLSESGQKAIAGFAVMGTKLFTPNAGEEFCRECR
jgi:tungstate transport system substrate-binding protein